MQPIYRMFLIPLLTINFFSLCGSYERESAYERVNSAWYDAKKIAEVYSEQQFAKYFFSLFLASCMQLKTSPHHNDKRLVRSFMHGVYSQNSLDHAKRNHLDIGFFEKMAKIYQEAFPYNYNHCTALDIKPALTYAASYGLVDEVRLALKMSSDVEMAAEDCVGRMPLDKITDLVSERLRYLESITSPQVARELRENHPVAQKRLLRMQTGCKSLIRDLNYRRVVKTMKHHCKLPASLRSLITQYVDENDTYAQQEISSCTIL